MDVVGRGVWGGDGDGAIVGGRDLGGEGAVDAVGRREHDGGGLGRRLDSLELDDGVVAGVIGRGDDGGGGCEDPVRDGHMDRIG